MSPVFAAVALALAAAAVVAVSARDARLALVGVAVILMASPFLADSLPPVSTLATRIVAGALAAWLLRAAISPTPPGAVSERREPVLSGSRTGWPTEGLLALAGWVVGLSLSLNLAALNPAGSGASPVDPMSAVDASAMATATGLAMIVVAVVPALWAWDGFRTAVGMILLVQGVELFRTGVAGAAGNLEQLAGAVLTIAVAVTGSLLIGLSAGADRIGAGGDRIGAGDAPRGDGRPARSAGSQNPRRSRATAVEPE